MAARGNTGKVQLINKSRKSGFSATFCMFYQAKLPTSKGPNHNFSETEDFQNINL